MEGTFALPSADAMCSGVWPRGSVRLAMMTSAPDSAAALSSTRAQVI